MTARPLIAALWLAACTQSPSDRAPRATFWSAQDWDDAARRGASLGEWSARSFITPAGQPLALLSDPYAAGVVGQRTDFDGLNVLPAFAEGAPAAYLVAEVFANWAPLWIQPLYVPVTAWDAADPASKALPGALPVFSVGVHATFYSPYWRVTYAVVPADTPPDALTARKAVLDRASELHPGPSKVCSFVPEGLRPAVAQGAEASVQPLTGQAVESVQVVKWWADGVQATAIDFGTDRFESDGDGEVAETALFAFASLDATGQRRLLELPKVGGVGPFRSGKTGRAPGNRPAFGSLWRLHTALLPATAGVFVPSSLPALRAKVLADGLAAPRPAAAIEARADARDFLLRVALNPTCFQDAAAFPATCAFLDSQAAIERLLPTTAFTLEPTVMNGPLLVFNGQKVPFP